VTASFDPLPSDKDVYRAASPKTWIDVDAGRLSPAAFKMKKADVEAGNGLSVIISGKCPNPEDTGRKGVRAVGALRVGGILNLELGLEVIQDADYHAGIHGLPFTEDETDLKTLQQMDDCAIALADISTICSSV